MISWLSALICLLFLYKRYYLSITCNNSYNQETKTVCKTLQNIFCTSTMLVRQPFLVYTELLKNSENLHNFFFSFLVSMYKESIRISIRQYCCYAVLPLKVILANIYLYNKFPLIYKYLKLIITENAEIFSFGNLLQLLLAQDNKCVHR